MRHAVRANLLAKTTAALLWGMRALTPLSYGPNPKASQWCGRIKMTLAACTKSILR
jgi:hypothetical protein